MTHPLCINCETPEEREEKYKGVAKGQTAAWANVTDEQYTARCAAISKGQEEAWASLTDEEYTARCEAQSAAWASLTDEEYTARCEAQSAAWTVAMREEMSILQKELWLMLPEEEKLKRIERLQRYSFKIVILPNGDEGTHG